MRRFCALLFVLCPVLAITTVPATSSPRVGGAHSVRLGAVLSLSGPYGTIGRQEQTALHIAVDTVNATGGINGSSLRLQVEDDHSSPADALAATRQLLHRQAPVAIIGGSYNATCEAMRTLTEASHVVQYCLSGNQTDGGTFFASFPSPGRAFGDLPAVWMKRAGYKRLGVIASADHAGQLYSAAIQAAAKGQQIPVVATTTFRSDSDVHTALDGLLRAAPDVVYVGVASGGAVQVLSQLQARKITTPIWLVSVNATRSGAKALAPFLPSDHVYSAATKLSLFERLPLTDPQRLLLTSFSSAYVGLELGQSPDVFAAIAADAAEFLVAGLRADHNQGGLLLAKTIELTPRAPGLYAWYRFGPHRHNGTELPGIIVRFSSEGVLEYTATINDADVPAYAHVGEHRQTSLRLSSRL